MLLPPSTESYNFTTSVNRVNIKGQEGQPVKLDEEIFKNKNIPKGQGFYIGKATT